ncbi:MAG TPA: Uma2 family endonuclease [Blastocatellia bacterium]|nr:Uma2 family endonuclease [Blastocatellia bacterium]
MSVITQNHNFEPGFVPRRYTELIRALPIGATLQMTGITWQEYEDLLVDLDEQPRFRLTFDQGRLEITTLSPEHEGYSGLFSHLIQILTEELGTDYIALGSTTLRDKTAEGGTEADDCFYIGDFAAVAGKKRLDLSTDPPPDLAVEIDVTHDSLHKFSIYADLKVREIWRFDGKQMQFHRLSRNRYREVGSSGLFPFLTPEALPQFLEQGRKQGINAMWRAFREWVRTSRK